MKVIKNAHVLRSNYIPEKLLHREDLVDDLKLKVEAGTGNILLLGEPGTGKTAATLNALGKLSSSEFTVIYINCVKENTFSSVAKRIIEDLRGTVYLEKGKSTSEISNDLTKSLVNKNRKKQPIIVIDEVDKLINRSSKERDHQQVLGVIADNSNANMVLISNDIIALKNLDARIESRLSPQKKFVQRYFANEILDILKDRAKNGLKKGSYDLETIAAISKRIYQTSGDLREALNLLYELAILSEKKKCKLTSNLIQEAWNRVGEIDFDEIFTGLTDHKRYILACLVEGCLSNPEGYFPTRTLYNSYEIMAKDHGDYVLEIRQFERLLKQLELLKLFEIRTISPKNRRGREVVIFTKFDIRRFAKKYLPRYSTLNDNTLGVGVGA